MKPSFYGSNSFSQAQQRPMNVRSNVNKILNPQNIKNKTNTFTSAKIQEDLIIPSTSSQNQNPVESTQANFKSRVIKFEDSPEGSNEKRQDEERLLKKPGQQQRKPYEKRLPSEGEIMPKDKNFNRNSNNQRFHQKVEQSKHQTQYSQGYQYQEKNYMGYQGNNYSDNSERQKTYPRQKNLENLTTDNRKKGSGSQNEIDYLHQNYDYLQEMVDMNAQGRNQKLQEYSQENLEYNNDQKASILPPIEKDASKHNNRLLDEMFERHQNIRTQKASVPAKNPGRIMQAQKFQEERKIEAPRSDVAASKRPQDKKAWKNSPKKKGNADPENVLAKCSRCEDYFPIDVLMVHESECDGMKIPCEKCGERVLINIYEFHLENQCKRNRKRHHNHHHHHRNPLRQVVIDEFGNEVDLFQLGIPLEALGLVDFQPAGQHDNGGLGTYEELLALDDNKVHVGMSEEEINRFQVRTYFAGNGSSECCNVCLTDYESGNKLRKLKCGHEFHKECVDTWLKDHTTCPVCKAYMK